MCYNLGGKSHYYEKFNHHNDLQRHIYSQLCRLGNRLFSNDTDTYTVYGTVL